MFVHSRFLTEDELSINIRKVRAFGRVTLPAICAMAKITMILGCCGSMFHDQKFSLLLATYSMESQNRYLYAPQRIGESGENILLKICMSHVECFF